MRPPNRRLANNGRGRDIVVHYPLSYAPDDEGNPIRVVAAQGVRHLAIVTPSFAGERDESGTEYSVCVYTVMLYTTPDPGVKREDPLAWRGLTLVAQGDAVGGAGCWAFQAMEVGPDPDGPGLPAGVGA